MTKRPYTPGSIRELGSIAGVTRGNDGGALCDNSSYNAHTSRGTDNPSGFPCDIGSSSGPFTG